MGKKFLREIIFLLFLLLVFSGAKEIYGQGTSIKNIISDYLGPTFDRNFDGKVNLLDIAAFFLPATPTPTPLPASLSEWSQHAHDAQHTSYSPDQPPSSPSFAWQWNGSDSSGGLASGHIATPRLVQPITGGGRVYIPYGNGITARSETTGAQVWNVTPGGSLLASAAYAYDPQTPAVFVGSTNGNLYKLNAATGATVGSLAAGGAIRTPTLLVGDYVYVSAGNFVVKVNKNTMQQVWRYDAGAFVQQVPAYSPSRDILIVGSSSGVKDSTGYEHLNVIAINNSNGTQKWRVDPNPDLHYQPAASFSPPQQFIDAIEWENGWPVIAENIKSAVKHGLVLMQLRNLWYYEIDGGYRYPTNDQYRTALTNNPNHRKLYVLSLDNGSQPFLTVVQNAGFNNSSYSPMGPQPVIKVWPNGDEVAYTITYNSTANGSCTDNTNRQCGAAFAELLLDNTTVPGYQAGDVRLIKGNEGTATLQTDEHGYMSMAGDMFFYDHWAFAAGHRIINRADSLGMPYTNAIQAGIDSSGDPNLVLLTENNAGGTCAFSNSHYCNGIVGFEGGARYWDNGGFYVYRTTNKIYDQYWTEGVFVTFSNNRAYFRSNDGAIMALEPQNP